MNDYINIQDIINSSFMKSIERENELLEKYKRYKNGKDNNDINEMIESFIKQSNDNLEKINELLKKMSLCSVSKNKVFLTQLDKLQIILKDKIELQELYNELSIKNQNPEVRKLFIHFRDVTSNDIYNIQQIIQRTIQQQNSVTKTTK